MQQIQLELGIEYQGKAVPSACVNLDVSSRLDKLRKKVFRYDSSLADERAFKQRIVDYLNDKAEESLTKTMWHIVWERNEQGKYLKYCYFNEYAQKVYLDKDFFEWCKLICQALNELLYEIDEQNGC